MNFPPILFYDPKFQNLFSNNYMNQNLSSLSSYQNLYKKLMKFENKDKKFQSNVISWLKTLKDYQRIKYFSFGNQWFVDILHHLILIYNYNNEQKFIFNPDTKNKDNRNTLTYINFLEKKLSLYNPLFADYFTLLDTGIINLSGNKDSQEKAHRIFIDNIRYITISKNNQLINNNEEKYFFDYNNVVTLSYDYLSNIDQVIENMLAISGGNCFKQPIEIDFHVCESGGKIYNACMPKWLDVEFSLPELLCSYFEQSILMNYQYFLLYKEEIPFFYYDNLGEFLDNIFKLKDFIGNSNEKKDEIFYSVNKEEIKKIIQNNQSIRKIIFDKKRSEENIKTYYIGNFQYNKSFSTNDIISRIMLTLHSLFINGDLNFILFISFIRDSFVFSTEDFIIKIVFEIINNFRQNKIAEDLLKDITPNQDIKKKKKRRKKKNKNKNEDQTIVNDLEESEKDHNKEDKINFENNNNRINKNLELKLDDNNDNNLIDINNDIMIIRKKDSEKAIDNKIINNSNKKMESNETENNLTMKNRNEENQRENKEETQKNINKMEDNKKEVLNEENDKKNEKNFFLFPVLNKKKKNKNKNKKRKKKTNKNNIEILSQKQKEEKIKEEEENMMEEQKLKNEKNYKKQEQKNPIYLSSSKTHQKNELDCMKQKNKFNVGNKNKLSNHNFIQYNHSEILTEHTSSMVQRKLINNYNNSFKDKVIDNKYFNNNGNIGYFNDNKTENNILRSKEDDKYFLAGANSPKFTSFYFKSKNRNFRRKQENNPYSFISNNIQEFSKEIIDNTSKVNKNKEILQKIREKYIKTIYEKINSILFNEKLNFLCSFYGSSISGLSIENSDVDIMVKLKKDKNDNNFNYIRKVMDIIVYNLGKSNINYISNIFPIYTASVPVIKLECNLCKDETFSLEVNEIIKNYELNYDEITNLSFDITFFEVEKEENKIPSELMIDYIKECIIIYPKIVDIIYILKRFLFNRKLNRSYEGGISSYSLFLLTLAFIKYFENNYDMPIGSILIEYLNYYSNFDFYSSIIQPYKNDINEIYIKNDNNSILYKYNLNIIDPITGSNVSKSTCKMDQIKNTFKEGLNIIIGNLYKINKDNNNGKNKKILDNFFEDTI